MNMPSNQVVVRRPGEPTEEYQDQMKAATQSEYKNKLMDLEYKDSPKVKGEDFHSTKANMSLLKELLKDREENKDAPKEKENIMSKEEESKPSPVQAQVQKVTISRQDNPEMLDVLTKLRNSTKQTELVKDALENVERTTKDANEGTKIMHDDAENE